MLQVWYVLIYVLEDFITYMYLYEEIVHACFKMNGIILNCNLPSVVNEVPYISFCYFYNSNFTFHDIVIKVRNTFPFMWHKDTEASGS